MSNPNKLFVKLDGAEFSSEGDEKTVNEQYTAFLAAVTQRGTGNAVRVALPKDQIRQTSEHASNAKGDADGTIDRTSMDRVFAVDTGGLVSLKAMPKTEHADADGLLMILYGFQELSSNATVFSPTVMKAALKSGIQTAKISTAIAPNRQFINTSGIKRAAKYSLNNKGIARAKELILEVLAG